MPRPTEGVVPTGQRARRREQRLTSQVGGHTLVAVHRHRDRVARAARIPAPTGEHIACVRYRRQLHHRTRPCSRPRSSAPVLNSPPRSMPGLRCRQRVAGCVQREVHVGREGSIAIGTIVPHAPLVVPVGQVANSAGETEQAVPLHNPSAPPCTTCDAPAYCPSSALPPGNTWPQRAPSN